MSDFIPREKWCKRIVLATARRKWFTRHHIIHIMCLLHLVSSSPPHIDKVSSAVYLTCACTGNGNWSTNASIVLQKGKRGEIGGKCGHNYCRVSLCSSDSGIPT